MRNYILVLSTLALFPALSRAQDSWKDVSPTLGPGPRYQHAMAYDSDRNRVVLFGGRTKQGTFNDTWEFDGQRWLRVNTPNSPPNVSQDPEMVYDCHRRKMVMIRRESAATPVVAWEYDGLDWTSNVQTTAPDNGRFSIAYDVNRRVTVLFKEGGGPTAAPETWEYDGSLWSRRTPANQPMGVIGNAMAYDHARGNVILYGGYSTGGGSTAYTDTYEWDGVRGEWSRLFNGNPPSRTDHALAADPAHNRVILFGGWYPFSPKSYRPGTWQWDGSAWSRLSPTLSPPLRHSYGAATAPGGYVILYGGTSDSTIYGDTWIFRSEPSASATLVGPGCKGTHMESPELDVQSPPILGGALVVDIKNGPSQAPGLLFLGAMNPGLDLAAFGAPGCTGYTSFDWGFPISVNQSGNLVAPAVFPVPLVPALAGGVLHGQAFLLDPGANPLGVITSSGGRLLVGY
jgi:hypothetical protein